MARNGVSYSEVVNAITQLIGQQRQPTIEQIRYILGTGSSTTIANHLRQWKANQDSTSLTSLKANLPSEFIAMMKGLWERVINHSTEQVRVIEDGYQQTITELESEVDKYKNNNQRWQKMYNQWLDEKKQIANKNQTLEQALEFAHKESVSLLTKQDGLLQQLQDRQDRIDELHRLHKQAQENLEHYRESVREQRLLDQQQFDQQKQQLHFEIKNLQEQNQRLSISYSTLEKNHQQAQLISEQVKTKLKEAEKSINEHLNASQSWQKQYNELQKTLNLRMNKLSEIEKNNKLLLQEYKMIEQSLHDAEDQNKLLTHQKLELLQEKAHLEGRLSQIQGMIDA